MRRDDGFILFEVLVALAIAGIAVAVLFGTGSTALRSTRSAADYEAAVSRARSHLAALGRLEPLAPGEFSGDDGDGFRWRLRVQPIAMTPLKVGAGSMSGRTTVRLLTLYAVDVTIAWTMGAAPHALTLHTSRLAYAGGAEP